VERHNGDTGVDRLPSHARACVNKCHDHKEPVWLSAHAPKDVINKNGNVPSHVRYVKYN